MDTTKGITRRKWLSRAARAGVVAAGALGGYEVGQGIGNLSFGNIAGGLKAALNQFYGVTHDVLAEVHGTAEKRLAAQAGEVREYVGKIADEYSERAQYWQNIGFLDQQDIRDMQQIVENVDRYTAESDLPERLTRLKDRLLQRGAQGLDNVIKVDNAVESVLPEGLRNFNKWFGEQIRGDKDEAYTAFQRYKDRLDNLVKVYDVNQDNRVSQTELLDQNNEAFARAQQQVVQNIETYLGQTDSPEEKEFFEGLRALAQKDPSGRAMADYLFQTNGHFQNIAVAEQLGDLSTRWKQTTTELKGLQVKMDEGLALKNRLREAQDNELADLRTQAANLYNWMDAKKEDFKAKGYDVNYELYPQLKELKDKIADGIDFAGNALIKGSAALGAAAGAVAGMYAQRFVPRPAKLTRREFLTLRRKEKVERENEQLRSQLGNAQTHIQRLEEDKAISDRYLVREGEEDL